ncbi:transposase [Oxyplasma meridianum]|uniref:Transposase n=1 Tax=Oxyplasma meridianum TaxID=3073602 RepID=A0AAX4NHB0_9ARCH
MVILLLKQWYNPSNPQVEREIRNCISFLNFIGYHDSLLDRITIWYFMERISKTGEGFHIFNEIRDQFMAKKIRVKKGRMQDASFILADIGNHGKPMVDSKTPTWKDDEWATKTKNHDHHFCYKAHDLVDEIKIMENMSAMFAKRVQGDQWHNG